jgi:hypothetical protein
MAGLARVDEEGRAAGAGQGGGDFAGDVPGFAHPQDDDATPAAEHQVAGARKALVEALHQGQHGAGLGLEDRSAQGAHPFGAVGIDQGWGLGGDHDLAIVSEASRARKGDADLHSPVGTQPKARRRFGLTLARGKGTI